MSFPRFALMGRVHHSDRKISDHNEFVEVAEAAAKCIVQHQLEGTAFRYWVIDRGEVPQMMALEVEFTPSGFWITIHYLNKVQARCSVKHFFKSNGERVKPDRFRQTRFPFQEQAT